MHFKIMCLTLVKPKIKTNEVYKIYKLKQINKDGTYNIKSAFQYSEYKNTTINTEIVSNRVSKKITYTENADGVIHEGLHVFTHVEDAISTAKAQGKRMI